MAPKLFIVCVRWIEIVRERERERERGSERENDCEKGGWRSGVFVSICDRQKWRFIKEVCECALKPTDMLVC